MRSIKSTSILVFVLFTLLPLFAGLSYSLMSSFGLTGILSNGFTMEYWKQVFTTDEFLSSILYSFLITSAVIILSVFIALFLQTYLKRRILSGPTSYIMYIPLAIPFVVAAYLSYQFLSASGFFARIAFALHLISDQNQFPGLVNDANSIGIIITHFIIASSFFTILFSTVFINEKLDAFSDAAKTLGADTKNIRRKIIFPVLLKKTTPVIILYAIFVFGSYEIPLLLGRQDPQMISVTVARKFQRYNLSDVPVAYTMASIYTMLIIAMLYMLYKRNKLSHEEN